MSPDAWARVEELFHRACLLAPGERAAFLQAQCGADSHLRAEVEGLLAQHDEDPAWLDGPPRWLDTGTAPAGTPDEPPPTVGPYRILRVLGRGGMGSVYLAEREAREFRQQVAVKVIRRGLDTDDVIARFRTERQILARLNHPNIARLFDVGATDAGLPFYVMEYVDGVPLPDYCEAHDLDVEARLRLFQTVCSAVHHAHRNLVVHRDIKPGNILVTGEGVPKLLDFGIARILASGEDEAPRGHTQLGARVLTPGYSAPEQILGGPITTACDSYALGVLLYELLAGTHPFRSGTPGETTAAELRRRTLEGTPPPPSRSVGASPLQRRLRGDLDTIVLKAMHRDPEDRYPSVLSLSEDIDRYLAGLPVAARHATVPYALKKFVRRNRVAVAVGGVLFLTLAGATAVTLHQASRIRQESARVMRERDKALQVQAVLLEMFGTTGPDQPTGDTVTAREILDRRASTLDATYPDDPEMRAELRTVLAEGYEKLGLLDRAEPLARDALQARRELFGPEHPDVAVSLNVLGWIVHERAGPVEAEPLLREAVAIGRRTMSRTGDGRLARALNDLGVALEAKGEYGEAAALYRESLEMRRRLLGETHPGIATTLSNLSVVLYRNGDLDGAAAAATESLRLFERTLGPDHQRSLIVRNNLAAMQSARGDHAAAAAVHGDLLERRQRLFGPEHPSVVVSMNALAFELMFLDEHGDAEDLLRQALALQRARPGPPNENLAVTLRILGDLMMRTGRASEARPLYDEAIAILEETVGPQHRDLPHLRRARAAAGS